MEWIIQQRQGEFIIKGEEARMESNLVLYYQGHASLRITTEGGKVIYVDPYAGDGYDQPADLVLMTHDHYDHVDLGKIRRKAPDFRVIRWKDALHEGVYETYELGYVKVEAVPAGNNPNHDIRRCVGFVLTFPSGVTLYLSGDTSYGKQMEELGKRNLDYAFFCGDGIYNMDVKEASRCAQIVRARHSIPYHLAPGKLFDREKAEEFDGPGKIILEPGEQLELKSGEKG